MSTPVAYDQETQQLICRGKWNLSTLSQLEILLNAISLPTTGVLHIDGTGIETMDTAGAWLLSSRIQRWTQTGLTPQLKEFSEQANKLLEIVRQKITNIKPEPQATPDSFFARIGKNTVNQLAEFNTYLGFIGKLTMEMLRIGLHPKHIRWNAVASVIYRNGLEALPIVALLSFMIGVVITYQMAMQLRSYGANIYIVDLLGLSILREFGPLLTAIIIAGRTGSAFTAQLGLMKVNQEIDALDTMGITSAEILILPRIFGLFIALPLLTIWADIFGVLGGMIMSHSSLSITWDEFIRRFDYAIPLRALLIGLGKAPIFALLISTIGCFQGLQVKGNADSIGENTTRSVVLGIFFIIVVDGLFSILFSKLQL